MPISYTSDRDSQYRALLGGLAWVVAAAIGWGIGNYVTALSSLRYPTAISIFPILDISIANILGGLLSLYFVVLISGYKKTETRFAKPPTFAVFSRLMFFAVVAKSFNTFFFVCAVSLASASVAAALESLYVVWLFLIAVLVGRAAVPRVLYASLALVIAGVALALRLHANESVDFHAWQGAFYAVVAGILYALYVANWRVISSSSTNVLSSVRLTTVLLAGALSTLIVVRVAYGLFRGDVWLPLWSLQTSDLVLQLLNGTYNVGLTYFMISEALRRMEKLGRLSEVVVGLGLPFAIGVTAVCEILFRPNVLSLSQLIGLGLLVLGVALAALARPEVNKKAGESSR